MNFKHFLKTLLIFAGMILLGLLGIYLVSHFDENEILSNSASSPTVAK